MTTPEPLTDLERRVLRRQAAHLQIEADHLRRTGSDDFDVPEIAHQVRALAGFKPVTPETGMAAAERSLRRSGLEGERLAIRLAEIRTIMGWDEA